MAAGCDSTGRGRGTDGAGDDGDGVREKPVHVLNTNATPGILNQRHIDLVKKLLAKGADPNAEIINSRGRHLRRRLTDLLKQLDPALTETVSRAVAERLLTHPLVSGSSSPVTTAGSASGGLAGVRQIIGGRRLGNVVHREEFTKLLMILATDDQAGLEAQTKTALDSALKANGIDDPQARLKDIRMAALRLEQSNPQLSHMARQTLAILRSCVPWERLGL